PKQSPGLRGTSYPDGVVPSGHDVGATPLGLKAAFSQFPRVARSSQPWAGGHNPFGIGLDGRAPPQIELDHSISLAHSGLAAVRGRHLLFGKAAAAQIRRLART